MKFWYKLFSPHTFADYIDGTLSAKDNNDFAQKYLKTERDIDKAEELKELVGSLHSLPKFKTSANFEVVLKDRIRREAQQHQPLFQISDFRTVIRTPAFAASACLFLAIGFFSGRALSPVKQRIITAEQITPKVSSVQIKGMLEKSGRVNNYVIERVYDSDLSPQRITSARQRVEEPLGAESSQSNAQNAPRIQPALVQF